MEYRAAALRRDELMELRREALVTSFPDDGLIVGPMLQRGDERRTIRVIVQDLENTPEKDRNRLAEPEAVRADRKRRRYYCSGSSFGDGSLVAMTLARHTLVEGAPGVAALGSPAFGAHLRVRRVPLWHLVGQGNWPRSWLSTTSRFF